jgi:hypothetical protein
MIFFIYPYKDKCLILSMAKSAKEKKKPTTINEEQLIDKEHEEDATTQHPIDIETDATFVLMPELEELVKKNPNRLIGCGG